MGRKFISLIELLLVLGAAVLAIGAAETASYLVNLDAAGTLRTESGEVHCPHCNLPTEQQWPYKCRKCGWRYQ